MQPNTTRLCVDCGKENPYPRAPRCRACSSRSGKQASAAPVEDRFWSKVDRSGGPDACWPFLRGKNPRGYGRFRLNGRNRSAHCVAYFLTHGEWPSPHGLHTCDNPPCCNPCHIFPGTHADNAADRERKGRGSRHGGTASGERNGAYTKPERRRRGDANGRTRISDVKVQEIRQRYALGGITFADLGRLFGVDTSNARKIALGLTRVNPA